MESVRAKPLIIGRLVKERIDVVNRSLLCLCCRCRGLTILANLLLLKPTATSLLFGTSSVRVGFTWTLRNLGIVVALGEG